MRSAYNSISLHLAVSLFLLSALAGIVLAAIQLHLTYTSRVRSMEQALDRVARSDVPDLSATLWSQDFRRLRMQLRSIVERPGFAHAHIINEGSTLIETPSAQVEAPLERDYALSITVGGDHKILGILTITASLDEINRNIRTEFLATLVTQIFSALAISLIATLIFSGLVRRHLLTLRDQIRKLVPGHMDRTFSLNRRRRNDELQGILDALEDMRDTMQQAFRALHQEISDHQFRNRELLRAKSRAEEIIHAQSRFQATTNHEIRTLLNAVLGMIHLAQDSPDEQSGQRYLATAATSSRSLLRLVNDILDLSRVEAARMPVEDEVFSISRLIDDLTTSHRALADRKHIELHCAMDRDVPRYLSGDMVRIHQIMSNLVSNAIKYTHAGRVDVRVSSLSQIRAGIHRIYFEVEDTGEGIPDTAQAQLFQPFFQASASQLKSKEGSGLGLSIVQQMVTLLGGSISFTSEPGHTLFGICLPLRTATALPLDQDTPVPDLAPLPPLKVLVAEDNRINSAIVIKFLEKLGHNATLTTTGTEALEQMRRNLFDVVLMDIQMPELDGEEATRIIRTWPASQGGKTPIIAMTAHASTDNARQCREAGMNGHLGKPFSLKDLHEALQNIITAHV